MSNSEIIPFGKYKGQPVDVLQQDRHYCEWLMGQDWLQTRFPELRTVIINNFAEPTETPEHNALQARFLDGLFRVSLMRLVLGDMFPVTNALTLSQHVSVTFESDGADVVISRESPWIPAALSKEQDPVLFFDYKKSVILRIDHEIENAMFALNQAKNDIKAATSIIDAGAAPPYGAEFQSKRLPELNRRLLIAQEAVTKKQSDLDALDSAGSFDAEIYVKAVGVEIKPSMGDDYPAVMRQIRAMKADLKPALVLAAYTGVGATLDQVRAMFAASGIAVVLVSEIESLANSLEN